MINKDWVDYLTAIGSVATPVLVIFFSAVGWSIKSSLERQADLENKLRDDRIEIYNQILEPFILLLMSDAAWEKDKKNKNKNKNKNDLATSTMLSLDYRKSAFKLSLMGSDDVVLSYNNLMQYFSNLEESQSKDSDVALQKMIVLLGTFLLGIRKSMGNETSELDCWDMCEWWMADARRIKNTNA